MNAFLPADILMPKTDHMEKWAVIACDQFTSDQAYWDRVRKNAEGAVSYKAMLFVPGEENENAFSGDNKGGITLYSNGVMIMEKCDKLVHDYFEFVKGVVDSPDLSLNISRELLQHDRQLRIIGQNLEKRIKGELEKLMRDDRPKYEEFYRNFGVHLKCGVCDEYGRYKDFLLSLIPHLTLPTS